MTWSSSSCGGGSPACGDDGDDAGDASGQTRGSSRPPAGGSGADCTLDDPVKVGVVFSQTEGAAVYGATQLNGVQLAEKDIEQSGEISYELIVEDDASDPAQGITAFEKLINADKVSVIIGPTLSNTAFSTDPVAQDAGVPVLGVSNTAEGITDIGDFVFRNR